MIQLLLAFLSGVLTVASPCVLPVLPVLLGASLVKDKNPLYIIVGFILSFTAAAMLFTLFTSVLGLNQNTMRNAAIALLFLFGALMLWPSLHEKAGSALLQGPVNKVNAFVDRFAASRWSGFLIGISLGILWTPCAGPVLGSILTLIATAKPEAAFPLLLAFALGSGLPMLAIAYGGGYISRRIRAFMPYAAKAQKGFGAVMIVFAVGMYFHWDLVLLRYLENSFPEAGGLVNLVRF